MGNIKLKWCKVILIISLCFNVLFLSSYAAIFLTLRKLSTPQGRVEYVAKHLKLTIDQKKELSAISSTIHAYRMENRKVQLERINEWCDELSKNDPDYEKINQLVSQIVDSRSKLLGYISGQIQPFVKDLTLEQRLKIVKKTKGILTILKVE